MNQAQATGGRSIVASGLNLWLPLKDPAKMPELIFKLQKERRELDRALSELSYVHFARFVQAPDVRTALPAGATAKDRVAAATAAAAAEVASLAVAEAGAATTAAEKAAATAAAMAAAAAASVPPGAPVDAKVKDLAEASAKAAAAAKEAAEAAAEAVAAASLDATVTASVAAAVAATTQAAAAASASAQAGTAVDAAQAAMAAAAAAASAGFATAGAARAAAATVTPPKYVNPPKSGEPLMGLGERGIALQVITEFDGDFDAYVMDFAIAIKDQFNLILSYVQDWPIDPATGNPLRVQDRPAFFLKFVRERDLGPFEVGEAPIRMFSAYPRKSVIDIIGAGGIAPSAKPHAREAVWREDVQANVLRGVNAAFAQHLPLRIHDAAAARALLGLLVNGPGVPQVSDDATWAARPDFFVNVGFTYGGLKKLGIAAPVQAAFLENHAEFVQGPDHYGTAIAVGDVDASQPSIWQFGGPNNPVDMMISVYANTQAVLAAQVGLLQAAFGTGGVTEVCKSSPLAPSKLPRSAADPRPTVHFGYVDDLAQPRLAIAGAPTPAEPAFAPDARVGEFLLGKDYENVYGGKGSLGQLPPELAQNATFAAVRIMEQDVEAFEHLLDTAGATHPYGREWVAAKLMGRWRDGTPMPLSPDTPAKSLESSNAFDYRPTTTTPKTYDDSQGLRCPMGAHARRMNPRSARVAGIPHSRRLMRRGMPYGTAYAPGGSTTEKRGLFGVFLCADIKRQYEFILREWAQGDTATTGIAGEQDPIIGAQRSLRPEHAMTGSFSIPMPDGRPPMVLDMPRLVKTVGSVYLFMPGLNGLRHLAGLAPVAAPAAPGLPAYPALTPAAGVNPATFDATDPEFRRDPFPYFAAFRAMNQPAIFMPKMGSYWVFGHAEIDAVVNANAAQFNKRATRSMLDAVLDRPKGLLTMDKPPHAGLRTAMEADFLEVLAIAQPRCQKLVRDMYEQNCQGQGGAAPVDWISRFARPLSEQIFFDLYGLPMSATPQLLALVREMLAMAAPDDSASSRLAIKRLQSRCAEELTEVVSKGLMIPGGLLHRVFGTMNGVSPQGLPLPFDAGNPPVRGASVGQAEQISNALTLMMAGLGTLQTFFFLAVWRLLEHGGAGLALAGANNNAIPARDVVNELLRFDMATPFSGRFAIAQGVTIGNVAIPKNARVILVWPSANRDAAHYGADADQLNFKRAGNTGPGFAFGPQTGRYCLARELIYAVGDTLVDVMRKATPQPFLPSVPDPNGAPGAMMEWRPTWATGAMFRPMAELPVHC